MAPGSAGNELDALSNCITVLSYSMRRVIDMIFVKFTTVKGTVMSLSPGHAVIIAAVVIGAYCEKIGYGRIISDSIDIKFRRYFKVFIYIQFD
jgi:hypothetical protein